MNKSQVVLLLEILDAEISRLEGVAIAQTPKEQVKLTILEARITEIKRIIANLTILFKNLDGVDHTINWLK